jgi:hypothetical protein
MPSTLAAPLLLLVVNHWGEFEVVQTLQFPLRNSIWTLSLHWFVPLQLSVSLQKNIELLGGSFQRGAGSMQGYELKTSPSSNR